ncbi:DNA polymerase IV [Acinetobacter apis]|uniref:DNA polymerase IV n=1 Tax=Acinetobacter apis TaxID=1229165 RepID=UPI000B597D07|nr:DNA polymerase IV [Acinetobacter apis]
MRKIIHIDMDSFYASVELRNRPELLHLPVVVSSHHPRAVILTASYPARQFGLRSAMPMSKARQLCPQVVVVEPHFEMYQSVSQEIHRIFKQYTHIVEPLSLDEAYLDVTTNLKQLSSATEVAAQIQKDIFEQTGLTASAGVAPNKLLAKIASDWHKPSGLFVIKPSQVANFLHDLPLHKIPGVGKVTQQKLKQLGLETLADVQHSSEAFLTHHFGKYGKQLLLYSQGIDDRPVESERLRQRISKETTFDDNRPISACDLYWLQLSEKVWNILIEKQLQAYGVSIKLKTSQFSIIQHSKRFYTAITSLSQLRQAIQLLLAEQAILPNATFRLIGVAVYQLESINGHLQLPLM